MRLFCLLRSHSIHIRSCEPLSASDGVVWRYESIQCIFLAVIAHEYPVELILVELSDIFPKGFNCHAHCLGEILWYFMTWILVSIE